MEAVKFALETSVAIKHSSVSIRPFVSGRPNFGLERYNMVVADGVRHKVGISVLGTGNIKTYITGLNEMSPDMQKLKELGAKDAGKKEEYEAKVLEIRKIVARAEREITSNYDVNPDDVESLKSTDFWSKVKTFKSVIPDTFEEDGGGIKVRKLTYWDDIYLDLDNYGYALDERDIKDLLIIRAIEAGGCALIATSYEEAASTSNYRFYLDKRVDTSAVKVSGKKLRDKAGQELLKLEKDYNKMFYVTKLISMDSLYYRKGGNVTPADILYDDCSKFIDGEGTIKSKEAASTKFLEYCKLDLDELKLRCMIQDGTAMRYLSYKPDGSIYYMATGTPMGKTVAECISLLKDPLSQQVYIQLRDQVEKDWTS